MQIRVHRAFPSVYLTGSDSGSRDEIHDAAIPYKDSRPTRVWRCETPGANDRACGVPLRARLGWLASTALLGYGTIAVTERYGAIGDDLVEREALRLVQHRAQGGVR